jgi:1-aminocyclopropane-1-carboxylate deaminase/D-cysteine desulfhydrase-like pyridoxal-dependent ACC family enzyme
MHALFARYPALKARLPHIRLTELPTPIGRADRLGPQLGLNSLMLKRDDQSALIYGGNKVRKLELLLAEALANNCDAVLTYGSVGSNHALASAIYARQLGLGCYAVLTDQPHTPYVANTLRYHVQLGTKLIHVTSYQDSLAAGKRAILEHPTGAKHVCPITWGGSSWLGATGYVAAALELADQLPTRLQPDVIYIPCGTTGTAVGLSLGLRLAGLPTQVQAVQVTPPAVCSRSTIIRLFEETNRELHERDSAIPLLDEPMSNLQLRRSFFGPGYAETTPGAIAAVDQMRKTEDVVLETTYTGKAVAALIDDAKSGALSNKNVLFWNTYNSRPYPENLDKMAIGALPDSLRCYLT